MSVDSAQIHPTRQAGVFVPVFALRRAGDAGCGDTRAVREMARWCSRQGFRVLQLLPINETSGDNSPYNAISSCALDITTLTPEPKEIPGLTPATLASILTKETQVELSHGPVAYRRVKALKWSIVRAAFDHFEQSPQAHREDQASFARFCAAEKSWLDDYALFRALVEEHDGSPVWEAWPARHRTPASARAWLRRLGPTRRDQIHQLIRFYQFAQWVLYQQWEQTARAAAHCGVSLMGDIPFGISRSSADVWAAPEQFDLQWSGGAPPEPLFQPDEFTKKWGQNWGIPLYRWDVMEKDGFSWWRRRVQLTTRFFRIFRIDHVLGFYRIFAFPWPPQDNHLYTSLSREEVLATVGDLPRFRPRDDESEASRQANQAEGERLLRMIQEAAGDAIIVAEDLGVVPVYVRPSLQTLGISGYKIPMFERDESSREYRPLSTYPILSLAALSTHDHETMRGMWERLWGVIESELGVGTIPEGDAGLSPAGKEAAWELYRLLRFAGLDDRTLIRDFEPSVRPALLRAVWQAPSWLAIALLTDLFGLNLRFNVPGPVSESNWSERLPFMVEDLLDKSYRPDIQATIRQDLAEAQRLPLPGAD